MLRKHVLLLDAAPGNTNPAGGGGGGAALPPTVTEVENRTRELERNRVRDIHAAAKSISGAFPKSAEKFRSLVDAAVEGGTSAEEFRANLMAEVPGMQKAEVITSQSLGMSDQEQQQYSIVRGIQRCIDRNTKVPDGLEGEVHKVMSQRIGNMTTENGGAGGFWVPFDRGFADKRSNRMNGRRDMSVGTFGLGGAFVQTTILTPIIEILRNRMVTQRLGVQSMGGLEGNVAIPRQTGAATAYSLAESAALTVATQALDQVLLTPHRVGAVGKYSKQLLLQSSVDVENFIRDDLMKVLAIKWDKLILEGSGAGSEPTGILNTAGIGSVTFGGAISWAKVLAFETALALANADEGSMAYITTPSVREKMKSTAKLGSTFPVFIWEPEGMNDGSNDGIVNSYRAACTNQIANNAVAFGHWADAIHALWGGFDVVVNPYTYDTNAQVQITINTFGDVAARHAASFAWSSDSGAQ